MRINHLLFWVAVLGFIPLTAVKAENRTSVPVIRLWSGKAPGATGDADADIPILKVYLPKRSQTPRTAIVICPGGGYRSLVLNSEGEAVAQWLSQLGVAGFVLKYRLPGNGYRYPIPLLDARRALALVRSRANEWKVDPHRVGVMGFSAGGHLASALSTHFTIGDPNASSPIDRISNRPDFTILLYPVISMQDERLVHKGSRDNLLGPNPDARLLAKLSNETQVTAETPPAFIACADDDAKVSPENSVDYYLALHRAGVPAEMHVFEKGGHGFANPNKSQSLARDTWRARCADWMRSRGLMR